MRGKTSEVVYTAAKSSPTELSKMPVSVKGHHYRGVTEHVLKRAVDAPAG